MPADSQTLNVQLTWSDVATGEGREFVGPLPVTFGRTDENTVVLSSNRVSRRHATLRADGGRLILQDLQSTNGTFVNDERITEVQLASGSSFQIGPFHFTVREVPAAAVQAAQLSTTRKGLEKSALFSQSFLGRFAGLPVGESALVFSHDDKLLPEATKEPVEESLPLGGMRQPIIPMNEIYRSGLPVIETTYLAVGGGIGSFAWVDHLRIFGVPADQIAAIGLEPRPMGRYSRLCGNSQIPLHERLRSNSESCPDNIWGWPSYGLREIFRSLGKGELGNAWWVAKHVFGEPSLTYTYTPRSGDVFRSVDKEAQRIGWGRIWRYGRAQAIRKTDDGRYVVAYMAPDQRGQMVHHLAVGRYVQLAMGYPGIKILDDINEYRERTRDYKHTVNAYEEHNHVYEDLKKNGGVVMIRGRGIVASRVIQRLYEVRQQNKNIVIIHVHRNPVPKGHRDGRAVRRVINHVELQPFNWPKGCWTGSMRIRLERADDAERDRLLNDWGGTTTADRTDWQKIANRGLREGWYQIYFGEVKRLERSGKGQVVTQLSTGKPNQPEIALITDYIIDCTGLTAAIDKNPMLNDMVNTYSLGLNPKGRLRVTNDFEVEGMSNGPGRVYACGAMTLGGPHAVVDSFLGLQYAGLRAVEDLVRLRAPGLRKLTPLRSFSQWMRWVRGAEPNRSSSAPTGTAYAGGFQGQAQGQGVRV
ncbi:MAG TPA: FHA domain-containing protein [Ktedonobacteraceae bacterium]|nr:FHA domain-containing protein [Ktedonobacteraceae bacterium]